MMAPTLQALVSVVLLSRTIHAQLQSQNDTWNSSFHLTRKQIETANISETTASNLEVALNYERTNNAGSLVQDDPFYDLPADFDHAHPPAPGTVIKVEQYTNTTLYTLPMSLSMSRFLYMTETYNGKSMPASAYVLWPYLPRTFTSLTRACNDKSSSEPLFPIIGFAHGTFGQTQACAPSGVRALADEFHEPFTMALNGYAVIAPDYLGTGVANTTTPYFILPSQANDLFFAIEAAQQAWSTTLSKEFVIAGQSQGGGVTWAGAQRQHQRPVEGYLGTLAASPFTNTLASIAADSVAEDNARVAAIAQGLNSVLPSFQLSDWLTDAGIARLRLLQELYGCGTAGGTLFSGEGGTVPILQADWNKTSAARWYQNASSNGDKPFAGPMLVIQGTEDPNANEPVTTNAVHETCTNIPHSQIEYIRFENIGHVPVLYAGMHTWLDWIHDRFAGVSAAKGCSEQTLMPSRGSESAEFKAFNGQTWFLEYDQYGI